MLCLRPAAATLCRSVCERVDSLITPPRVRYRGCRGGRKKRPVVTYRSVGGAFIVTGNRPLPWRPQQLHPDRQLTKVRSVRHSIPVSRQVTFGLLNVQSANNKIDGIIDIRHEEQLDVLLLTETWHDSDSVSIRRLRADNLQLVERSRPRTSHVGVNHGGVVIAAGAGLKLTNISIKGANCFQTFEHVCARISSNGSTCVVLLIYRPGSAAISDTFFTELSFLLEYLGTLSEALFITGDFNVRIDRPDDIHAHRLADLMSAYNLTCHVNVPTHIHGGTLDLVATRNDAPAPVVDVTHVGFSDHMLVRWSACMDKPEAVYKSFTTRPWSHLDVSEFSRRIGESLLPELSGCSVDVCSPDSVERLSTEYDCKISAVVNDLIPNRTVTCRSRISDPWYDDECREAKRHCRTLERLTRRSEEWRSALRSYRALLNRKRTDYWNNLIETQRSTPRLLWKSIDTLLGRRCQVVCDDGLNADTLMDYSTDKLDRIRASTANQPDPTFTPVKSGCAFEFFSNVSSSDVHGVLRSLADKQSDADPLPTRLLKQCADTLSPYISQLINSSLSSGHVPSSFKSAYITPLLKKPGLDESDPANYRPVSNLSVMSKTLERVVAKQVMTYLTESGLLPRLQSAYRRFHSTETAIACVLSDILTAIDKGDLAALALLDLSAAFDTVDHEILLRRLQVSYGINGTVLRWFRSYLTGRTQHVRYHGGRSRTVTLSCGVPQGSVLGPILFLLYAADLGDIVTRHGLTPHMYADDTQVYGACRPTHYAQLSQRFTICINDVADWMARNRLQLNSNKTEFIWLSTSRRRHQIPADHLIIGTNTVPAVASARNIGVYVDSVMSMREHITRVTSSCFAVLRQLRTIRRALSDHACDMLITSFIFSRLDYCNVIYAGLPERDLRRLQSIQNAAVRLTFGARRFEHVTPLLRHKHWLPVNQRITFKLSVLAFKCINGLAPPYLANHIHPAASDYTSRLRSAQSLTLAVPKTKSRMGDRAFAVACPKAWNNLPLSVRSAPSLNTFKKNLKTHLFRTAFGT